MTAILRPYRRPSASVTNRRYGAVFFLVPVALLWFAMCVETAAQQAKLERLWTGLVSTTPVSDIAVKGDAGYVVSARGLEVYDLRTSPTLRLHTAIPLIPRTDPRARLADDTLLLVWDVDTGISVYSVTDPFAPRFLNHLRLTGVYDADAQGTQLYAAWRDRDTPVVRQMDWTLTDSPPKTTNIMWSLNGFRKVQVSGRYVYALGYGPDSDWITIARIAESGPAQALGFFEPEWLFIQDFAARDSVLFVVPSQESLRESPRQSVIEYGVHSKQTLSLTFRQEYSVPIDYDIESMILEEERLLLHVSRGIVPGHSEHTLISARIGDHGVLDYRDTLNVGLVRESVGDYSVDGTILFWRNYTGLYAGIFDDEGRIPRAGNTSIGMLSYDVDGFGRDRVFAVTTDTLFGMDFSDPANPVFLSRLPLRAEGVAMIDRDHVITFDSVVRLIDVSNPRIPRVLDTLNLGEGRIVWEAEVRDSVIVLCCLEKGTVVLVLRGDRLYRACEIGAQSTDALWMDKALLLTTLDSTTAEWESLPVTDSRFEWCSPQNLHVWGKMGQALTRVDDTVIVGTGRALVTMDASGLPDPPQRLKAITDVRLDVPTGIEWHNGYLFVERTHLGYVLYELDLFNDLRRLGWWEPYWLGDQRFYITDSLLLSPEGIFGFQSFAFSFPLLSVPDIAAPHIGETILFVEPNPAQDQVFVQYTLVDHMYIRLRLYDHTGRQVRTLMDGDDMPGKHPLSLNLSELPVGIYWLRLEGKWGSAHVAPIHIIR